MARKKGRNSWSGNKRGHSAAAKKGWRKRGGRRKCANAGAVTLRDPMKAATSAFNAPALKRAGWIIGGNLLTTLAADQLMKSVSVLKTNVITRVGTVLLTSGLVAAGSSMVVKGHGNDVLLGGILSGLTRGLREAFPSVFGGLSDDLDGIDDYVDPREISTAMIGTGDYVDPRQIMNARGIRDYADLRQVQSPVKLDGLQDSMVAEELAMN